MLSVIFMERSSDHILSPVPEPSVVPSCLQDKLQTFQPISTSGPSLSPHSPHQLLSGVKLSQTDLLTFLPWAGRPCLCLPPCLIFLVFCTNILVLKGWVPTAPCPVGPGLASPVTQSPAASRSQNSPQWGALEGVGGRTCHWAFAASPELVGGAGVRCGWAWGKTLGDKGLTSSSSQAGAAFHHGEPSCRLPVGKMLCRWASAGVGVRVRLATALAALWFCVTGEGSCVGTRAGSCQACLAGLGRALANLFPLSAVACPLISTGIPRQLPLHFLAPVSSSINWSCEHFM